MTASTRILPPVGVFALFIGFWYVITYAVLDPTRRFLLPAPHEVVKVGFLDERNLTDLLGGLRLTTEVALLGLGIAMALGVAVALLMSQARWLELSLYPWAVVLQTIPILALVPLIGFWMGFGMDGRVVVCVLIALFPIIANTLFGLQAAEAGLHDLFTLHGANRLTRLRKLLIPASLPAMFAGFRISAGLSVIGAIVGDFFFKQGDPGLGILIDLYRSRLQSERMFAAIILSSLLGIAVFLFFGWLGRRVVGRWYHAGRGH
ncbi:ABC transporter permease [Phytohabitans rumicis]|uniref:Nitrate ABC transporter permease n=1 Tax=Phytohabitans rumicis TaxID=1076125 RepID=A0A6V8KPV0_9ACTN|nr:ABC transporter permease [Phytohabitans rumicis]GFJ87192.1 nitrate ABC transporter permease [Phytohabitans rumicis]